MNGLLSLFASSPEVTLEPLWESRLGRIIGTDGEGRPVVDFEGNPVGPRVARKAVRLDAEGLQAAVETRQSVLEEAAESRARVIQGQDGLVLRCGVASVTLLRNGKVSLKGSSVETTAEGTLRLKGMAVQVHTPGAQAASAYEEEARPREAGGLLPGEDAADVQLIQSQESLTLRCGRSSLTLLRSGRILLEGTYVETCAEGVIRLGGGSVRIN